MLSVPPPGLGIVQRGAAACSAAPQVVDRRTAPQRLLAYGGAAAALWWLHGQADALFQGGLLLGFDLQLRQLLDWLAANRSNPEVQAQLFESFPEAFPEL